MSQIVWHHGSTLHQTGGGERVILEGMRYLQDQGYRATLLLREPIANQRSVFDGRYAPDVYVAIPRKPLGLPEGRISELMLMLLTPFRLARALRQIRPVLVIANDQRSSLQLALTRLLLPCYRPRIVCLIHGSPFQFADDVTKYTLAFRRHFHRIRDLDEVYRQAIPVRAPRIGIAGRLRTEVRTLLQRLAVRRNHSIIVLTEKNRREIKFLYGHRRVVVASPGGFSMADFDYRSSRNMKSAITEPSDTVVLTVSRLVSKKRVDLALRAFGYLIEKDPESRRVFVIGGTGPEEYALRCLAKELGVEERVRFIGFVPECELRDWYLSCDVFISTDNADHDLSVLMALPFGCPVVVTTQYQIPSALRSARRLVYTADPTPPALGAALERAFAAPRNGISPSEIHEIAELSWERYFERVLEYAGYGELSPSGNRSA